MAYYDDDINLSVGLNADDVKATAQDISKDVKGIFDAVSGEELSTSFKTLLTSMDKALQKSTDFQQQLNELENSSIATEAYEAADRELTKLYNKIGALDERMTKFLTLGGKKDSKTFESIDYDIKHVEQRIKDVEALMQRLRDAGQDYIPGIETDQYQDLLTKLNQVNNQLTIYREKAYSAEEIDFSEPATGIARIIENIKQLIFGFRETDEAARQTSGSTNKLHKSLLQIIGTKIISGFKKLGSAISNLGKHAKSSSGGFEKGFKSFIRYGLGVRSIFALVNKLRRALFEGFGDLAQVHEPFNQAMSSMMTALNQLKNSFAAAFAPLIETVSPILTTFINKMSQAVTMVGQFIAALTGKEFVKAGTVQKDYAESVAGSAASASKAAKATGKQAKEAEKLKKTLAGFDDVEILKGPDEDTDSDTGTGDVGAGDLGFSTAPIESAVKGFADKIKEAWLKADFYDLGRILGQKLKDALDAIPWDEIKSMAWRIARSLATFLNGFIDTPGLFDSIGRTLAEAFNTALLFLYTFLTTFNWPKFGKVLADGVNSLVNNINWELLGYTLKSGINAVFNTWYNFVTNFDFGKFGKRIGDALSIAVKGINWTTGGASVAQTINGLFDALNGFITHTDWRALGRAVIDFIGGFFRDLDASKISAFVSNVFIAIYNFWQGAIETIDWETVPSKVLEIISNFFKGYKYEEIASAVGSLLGTAFKALVTVGGSLFKTMKDFGQSIIDGSYSGIVEKLKAVADWIKLHIFKPFIDAFKTAFGIESPAKEMKPLGENIIKGLFEGITDTLKDIGTWIKTNIVDPFVDGVKSMFGLNDSESELFKIGGQLIDGLKSGITGKLEDASSWFGNHVTGPILGFIKSGFGIDNNKSDKFSGFGETTMNAFQTGMADNTDGPINELSTLENNMEAIFTNPLEKWKTNAKNLLANGLKPGFEEFSDHLKSTVGGIESKLRGVFSSSIEKWKTGGSELLSSLNTGMEDKKADSEQTMEGIIDGVKDKATNHETLRQFLDAGKDIGGNIDDGLSDTEETLTGTASDLMGAIEDEFNDSEWLFESIGDNVGTGIYNGLDGAVEDLKTLAWNTAVAMYNEACAALGIASPSKKFAWIGKMTMQGLAGGVEDNSGTVIDTVANISEAMEQEAEKANPTITLTDSVDDWIGKLDDVLTKFGDAVTNKFDALTDSLSALNNMSMYPVPAIAQGRVIPSMLKDDNTSNSELRNMRDSIQALLNTVITRDDLQDILTEVVARNMNIEFYLGDEQIARHANSGNLKLGKRYNR